jgi:hypothetical protein
VVQFIKNRQDGEAHIARNALKRFVQDLGNTLKQIEYWFSYSSHMMAFELETLAAFVGTEAIPAKMQRTMLAGY